MLKKTLCLFLLFIACAGCSERVLLLKRLGSSQKEMENYIARQERGFLRLKHDIQGNRLQKGMSRQAIIKRYGEPVFCDPTESGTPTHPIASGAAADLEIAQGCLYRAPTEYFFADKVYLYFNRQELLHSWKYESVE